MARQRKGKKRQALLKRAWPWAGGLLLVAIAVWAAIDLGDKIRLRRYDPGRGRQENVILIISDALRPDHLSCYGYRRMPTPAIDLLAREGIVFDGALAVSTWTKTSVASLFTASYPIRHRVMGVNDALPTDLLTVAQVLQRAGYDTAAVMANTWLDERAGFARGFNRYYYRDDPSSLPAEQVVRIAAGWLKNGELHQPFFLLLYFMDNHIPYRLERGALAERLGRPEKQVDWNNLMDRYDSGVNWLDRNLAGFWGVLQAGGWWRDSLIILTSDHGEELMERGRNDHGHSLYDELLRVPLIVHQPGRLPAGRRVALGVENFDILPTVLEAEGLRLPPGVQAPSFNRLLKFGAEPSWPEVRYSQVGLNDRISNIDFIAASWGRYRLIRDRRSGAEELSDLVADPAQRDNHLGRHPAAEKFLRSCLRDYERSGGWWKSLSARPRTELSESQRQALKSLGYLQ